MFTLDFNICSMLNCYLVLIIIKDVIRGREVNKRCLNVNYFLISTMNVVFVDQSSVRTFDKW